MPAKSGALAATHTYFDFRLIFFLCSGGGTAAASFLRHADVPRRAVHPAFYCIAQCTDCSIVQCTARSVAAVVVYCIARCTAYCIALGAVRRIDRGTAYFIP